MEGKSTPVLPTQLMNFLKILSMQNSRNFNGFQLLLDLHTNIEICIVKCK